ncbi:4'-phosphopantetheinyl transferase family protein [Autumnicola musiva]|uniref:4'-phosphopantetheinyl transferase superfamily protein n=1 Tax=Autumnicola musiva TaxID=3075589 RepID=A0ABU3D690_9FLAO|nr:4'-phosphopantetheinyl transferase superfamily protein [Zunongwangia sp. F117]MDT0677019.1 4'-phosphopantetheinyl transferase superfamily protein [Zunongwangia sp. F117]
MIGNDIVDLRLAALESNIYRPRLQGKIFSEEEQEVIRRAKNQENQFWLFWAMKEAAYKAHQRRFGLRRKFNPKIFECVFTSLEKSTLQYSVFVEGYEYFIRSQISAEFIHCFALSPAVKENKIQFFNKKVNLRKRLISAVAKHFNLPVEEVKIYKDNYSIPQLIQGIQSINIPFSLSHHGRFSAIVFAVN